jgi:2-keto-4-pentenoate hydratase/2-oxohepta-3-ene-1,7-dioic acid hydratase in catechol pathway
VVCIGKNYAAHIAEMGGGEFSDPIIFMKPNTAIVGPNIPIQLPADADPVHFEGELAAVIGRPCKDVPAAQVAQNILGYTIANDVSARDWVSAIFQSQGIMGPIHAWEENLLGKMMPTFCPMGPCIATKDEVPDPANVKIQTRLNGKVMQDANTDDLVFSVVKLIEYYSQFYRFLPGDCITTGSPSGVGYGRNPKVFMKPGDTISVEVKGIGILSNPVKAS